jgi:hypothetical protein
MDSFSLGSGNPVCHADGAQRKPIGAANIMPMITCASDAISKHGTLKQAIKRPAAWLENTSQRV